jgi:hypothetical protein
MTTGTDRHTDEWWAGWRQGQADRARGVVSLICGGAEVAERNAGYRAGRYPHDAHPDVWHARRGGDREAAE